MSEEHKSGYKFLGQYTKDLSFENPQVPSKLPHMMVKPNINVSVNVNLDIYKKIEFKRSKLESK